MQRWVKKRDKIGVKKGKKKERKIGVKKSKKTGQNCKNQENRFCSAANTRF